jgi:DNA-directed RNA polymerase subunit A"
VDKLEGVTENIIVGQPIRMGTGDVHLVSRRKEEIEAREE